MYILLKIELIGEEMVLCGALGALRIIWVEVLLITGILEELLLCIAD